MKIVKIKNSSLLISIYDAPVQFHNSNGGTNNGRVSNRHNGFKAINVLFLGGNAATMRWNGVSLIQDVKPGDDGCVWRVQ